MSSDAREYARETVFEKFMRKSKEAPFVPLGMIGLIGAVAYGAMSYKNRGSMSTSVFIMQYRVIAQSMVVGAITIGVAATVAPGLYRKITGHKKKE